MPYQCLLLASNALAAATFAAGNDAVAALADAAGRASSAPLGYPTAGLGLSVIISSYDTVLCCTVSCA